MIIDNDVYAFVCRGLLAEASLDKVGRQRRKYFGSPDAQRLRQALCFDLLDQDLLAAAQHMSFVYAAIHSFENMVRQLVMKV